MAELHYSVRRTARARYLSLRIAPHTGVVVVAPPQASAQAVHVFVQRHAPWIDRQVARLAAAAADVPRRWPYGATLPYLGQEQTVHLRPAAISRVDHLPEAAALHIQLRRVSIESARRLLKRWYLREAERWCTARAYDWQVRLGVTWTRLQIRDQRARWGSCSPQGSLNFNYRLVMAPLPVLDYVVLHELAHRREMNHSKRFWMLVATHCPTYREAVGWLRRCGPYLGV